VKKGPGRRPLSAKRQRFMELRARGWSINASAREAGVSRSTGKNWNRGYKVCRHGQVVGFVPALDRLAVREISDRFLSQDVRIQIADLHHGGMSIWQIAIRLGRAPSTISRELRRNAASSEYRPFEAHRRATARWARRHPRHLEACAELGQLVGELLAQRWSPQQISRHLQLKFPGQPGMQLCCESIYPAVYQPGSLLLRPSPLARHRRSPLRTGQDHRRAHQSQDSATSSVRAAHADNPGNGPSRLRTVPKPGMGKGIDNRQGPGLGDRHARGTADQDDPAAVSASA
jgi:transposase, IS30 family